MQQKRITQRVPWIQERQSRIRLKNKMNNQLWSYGDTKIDRQGRTIYFIEYANQKDKKGNQIELWEPEDIFLARDLN